MKRKILRVIKRILNEKENSIENFRHNVLIGEGTKFDSVTIQARNVKESRKIVLTVGKECLISGNFVFESEVSRINIGDNTFIGGGLFICLKEIQIGSNVMFSSGCVVMDNDAHSLISQERINDVRDWKKGFDEGAIGKYKNWGNVKGERIIIKDKAWIGINSIILKNVTIGEGAVVGAGSVVRNDVPDYAVVMGNPAIIVKHTK